MIELIAIFKFRTLYLRFIVFTFSLEIKRLNIWSCRFTKAASMDKVLFLLSFILPSFAGCVSLSQVHNYAVSSVGALRQIDKVNYSFGEYCERECELQQMRKGEIKSDFDCSCSQPAANADAAIAKIDSTLIAYLVAIAHLTNNSQFTYDVSGLTQAVQNSNMLRLNDQQVSVATKAGNFLATAATSYYRRKKLRQYLTEADTIFRDLTETYLYIIDNRLRAQLKLDSVARMTNIKQMADNTSDRGLKQIFVKRYLDDKAYYNRRSNLLDAYATLLKLVKKGYHALYLHRYRLTDQATKDLISGYSADLKYILSSVKQ